MIHYTLHCTACGHDFDDWFANMADWEAKKAGFPCPACGTAAVEKALMAPRLAATAAAPVLPEPACNPAGCSNAACPMATGF